MTAEHDAPAGKLDASKGKQDCGGRKQDAQKGAPFDEDVEGYAM